MGLEQFGNKEITAASISRILKHFSTQAYDVGIAIVSADRGDRAFSIDEHGRMIVDTSRNSQLNNKMRKKLEALLKMQGHKGWIKTKGGFQETGMEEPAYEHSYVIPGVTNVKAKRLAGALGKGSSINSDRPDKRLVHTKLLEEAFRQDSILWGSNKAGVFLVDGTGHFEKIGSKFDPNSMEPYFTEWRKRRFAFASRHATAAVQCRLIRLEYIPTSPSDFRQFQRELTKAAMRL